jgi:colanic acid biosynthesis glycosyl transferase WcaI
MTSDILADRKPLEPTQILAENEAGFAPARVLICGMNYAPELTGIGRYTGELAVDLAARGNDVEVVTTPPHYPGWFVREPYTASRYAREALNGVSVFRCPILLNRKGSGIWRLLAPLTLGISSAPVIAWRILAGRPQVIVCVEPTLIMAPVAIALGRLLGSRLVLHVQDLEVDAAFAVGHLGNSGWLKRFGFAIERWLLRGFHRVITVSNQMAQGLAAKGVPADRLLVIRNWVNTQKIKPLGRPSAYRKELGYADDDFIVLYAGQIGAKQALHVVFEAAERLAGHPKIKFVVAGEGPLKQPLSESYAHLRNVRLLPLQPEERLCEFLNLADCHILPQDSKVKDLVLPSKLGGMLASGKPVLTMADADSELYRFLEGVGELVEPDDVDGVATRLTAMQKGERPYDAAKGLNLAATLSTTQTLRGFCAELVSGLKAK